MLPELESECLTMRHISFVLFLFSCAVALTAQEQAQSNHYVSNDVCRMCHPFNANTFFKNPHFKTTVSGKEPAEDMGCQACHGPGGNHVDHKGGKATIIAFSELPRDRIIAACLRCHSQTLSRANIRTSQHTVNGVVCTDCHSIHRAESAHLLQKPQTALCESCHTDVRAQFAMTFNHRVEEGVIACTDCHNPHGSFCTLVGNGCAAAQHGASGERRALPEMPPGQARTVHF